VPFQARKPITRARKQPGRRAFGVCRLAILSSTCSFCRYAVYTDLSFSCHTDQHAHRLSTLSQANASLSRPGSNLTNKQQAEGEHPLTLTASERDVILAIDVSCLLRIPEGCSVTRQDSVNIDGGLGPCSSAKNIPPPPGGLVLLSPVPSQLDALVICTAQASHTRLAFSYQTPVRAAVSRATGGAIAAV